MARREGADLLAQAHQVLGLAGKDDSAVGVVAVEERTDADGVPGGDEGVGHGIVDDESKLRVQPGKHGKAVLMEHGQKDLAVTVAVEGILARQLPANGPEAVELAVAHHIVPVQGERLHAVLGKVHDGQPVEAQVARRRLHNAAHVGPAGAGTGKVGQDLLAGAGLLGKAHDGTHKKAPPDIKKRSDILKILGRIAAIRGAT